MLRVLMLIIIFLMPVAQANSDEPRLALVISQRAYSGDLSRVALANSEADQIESALSQTGFSVTRERDLTKAQLEGALNSFRARLDLAGPEAVGFIYYTGHGAQHPGTNDSYLLGVNARLNVASDLAVYGLDMKTQRDGFAATGAKAVFLVFDACRNVPGFSGYKSPSKGLNRVEARADMLIAYATDLGSVAEEGVYAPVLAEEIMRPGQTAEAAFSAAQRRVAESTGRGQLPWTNNRLYNEVCFAGCSLPVVPLVPVSTRPRVSEPAPATSSSYRAGETFRDTLVRGGTGPEMTVLPSGSFMMGSPASETGRDDDEGKQRRVTIDYKFAVGTYEVSWDEWEACVSAGDCDGSGPQGAGDDEGWGKGSRPVINVSWEDARAYATWLSGETGATYRLLSESEWEYAARAGSTGPYPWGPSIGRNKANCGGGECGDQYDKTAPAGSFPVNSFGLHDMHGNVWEWVEDWYKSGYSHALSDGASFTNCSDCSSRVIRGGSWSNSPHYLRSADRNRYAPDFRNLNIGFRVARTLPD